MQYNLKFKPTWVNKNRFPLRLTSTIFRLHNSDVKNQRSLLECIVQVLKAIKISPYSMHFQAAKSILCADFSKHLETLITSLSH